MLIQEQMKKGGSSSNLWALRQLADFMASHGSAAAMPVSQSSKFKRTLSSGSVRAARSSRAHQLLAALEIDSSIQVLGKKEIPNTFLTSRNAIWSFPLRLSRTLLIPPSPCHFEVVLVSCSLATTQTSHFVITASFTHSLYHFSVELCAASSLSALLFCRSLCRHDDGDAHQRPAR